MSEPQAGSELSAISEDEEVAEAPDASTGAGVRDLEHRKRVRKLELDALEQDLEHRQRYAGRLFWVLCATLVTVAAIVIMDGFGPGQFELSDPVLISVLGSSTANVIGLFVVVARYIFPNRD